MWNYIKKLLAQFGMFPDSPSKVDPQLLKEFFSRIPEDFKERSEFLMKYRDESHPKDKQIDLKIIDRLLFELVVPNDRKTFNSSFGRSFQDLYEAVNKAVRLMYKKDFIAADKILKKQYVEIVNLYIDTDEVEFHNFDSSLQESLYSKFSNPEKRVVLIPCDYSHFYKIYGSLKWELKQFPQAIEFYNLALKYNPASCETCFDLCESYKEIKAFDKVAEISKQSLPFALTLEDIARLFRNLAICFEEQGLYQEAMDLLIFSSSFDYPKITEYEIGGLEMVHGIKPANPDNETIRKLFERHNIPKLRLNEIITEAQNQAKLSSEYGLPELVDYYNSLADNLAKGLWAIKGIWEDE